MYLPSVCEDVENQAGIWDVRPCSKTVIQTVDSWRKANALGECVSDVAKNGRVVQCRVWHDFGFLHLPSFTLLLDSIRALL